MSGTTRENPPLIWECLSLNPLALALVWGTLPPQPAVSWVRSEKASVYNSAAPVATKIGRKHAKEEKICLARHAPLAPERPYLLDCSRISGRTTGRGSGSVGILPAPRQASLSPGGLRTRRFCRGNPPVVARWGGGCLPWTVCPGPLSPGSSPGQTLLSAALRAKGRQECLPHLSPRDEGRRVVGATLVVARWGGAY